MESTSILAVTCFIFHICKYHNITINSNIWVHLCNNLSAVKRVQWFPMQNILTPAETMQPNFDTQLQIEERIVQIGTTWTLQHVKGHQNDTNTSWEAKLNNIAGVGLAKCEEIYVVASCRMKKHPQKPFM
eukprot:1305096-Ditylum_brightwellii.AAC.1